MSKERWFSRESLARRSLVFALALGLAATSGCTVRKNHTAAHATSMPSPTPSIAAEPTSDCLLALEQFSVDRNLESGGAYATNEGDCVNVFGPELDDTTGAVGRILAGETFYIDCYDLAASGLRVNVQGSKGLLDMTEYAMQELDNDPSARAIRTC